MKGKHVQVAHHRKKLQGRKLDYDCKKRKQQSGGGIPEKEIKQVSLVFSAGCGSGFATIRIKMSSIMRIRNQHL